jgi:anaerobic magnesium-protoporphyrin IX monomethyl ester cyclase
MRLDSQFDLEKEMRVLLVAMPDTADVIDFFGKLPNLGLVNLAGNLPGHEVKVVDLVLYKPRIRRILEGVLADFQPELVGLSGMTFQFDTLLRVARFLRRLDPGIKLAAGGYHATLMARELVAVEDNLPLDFLIRGEGEATFRDLVNQLAESEPDLSRIAGLSYRQGHTWRHNPDRSLLDLGTLPLPRREIRLDQDFFFFDQSIDVVETSRGCPYDCTFCSITRMYGRSFRRFPLERTLADLDAVRCQGTQAVFFADDNLTFDIDHFQRLCQAIVDHRLNDLRYATQASAVGLARHPELVAAMKQANFWMVFVGFESMSANNLKDVHKPTSPEINRRAAALLRQHDIGMIAGVIFGFPEDTRASITRNYRAMKKMRPDLIYSQYLTPYPKTRLRRDLLDAGLVANADNFHTYDGFHCNVRTRHLDEAALYQSLKRESLKSYFDPSLYVWNFFLRHHPLAFFLAIGRAMLSILTMVLRGRQPAQELDV